jgi:hypothetical protein
MLKKPDPLSQFGGTPLFHNVIRISSYLVALRDGYKKSYRKERVVKNLLSIAKGIIVRILNN